MSLRVCETLGAYEITGTLGSGGMGEVDRARDSRVKRDVALSQRILAVTRAADEADTPLTIVVNWKAPAASP
jgi:hypothetical protein